MMVYFPGEGANVAHFANTSLKVGWEVIEEAVTRNVKQYMIKNKLTINAWIEFNYS